MQETMLDVAETDSNKSSPCPQRAHILVGEKRQAQKYLERRKHRYAQVSYRRNIEKKQTWDSMKTSQGKLYLNWASIQEEKEISLRTGLEGTAGRMFLAGGHCSLQGKLGRGPSSLWLECRVHAKRIPLSSL